ncbi:sulfotransferase [Myxococcota bacterium]|nr:sulfotransferase [Myxococcota bacterium]
MARRTTDGVRRVKDGYPSTNELMERARAQTGLEDFGPDSFREGLEVLLESLAADAHFGPDERQRAIDQILRRLRNRLEIEAWFAAHPEAEHASVDRPLSIVGLPRTGTTVLGNMMSLDPQLRALRPWEQEDPCPPPRLEEEATDPRRLAYRDRIEKLMRDQPEQAAMHHWEVDATLEDTEVLGLEFRAQQMTMPVWRYHAWWRTGDMRAAFAYHVRVARLLQSSRPPNRWLYKAPHHKFHLEPIVEAYPDIRFVFTHRDPGKAVPSYASFAASLYPPAVVARIGREKIGREIHGHLLTGMKQALAARARLGPERFLDIHHNELAEKPIAVLERIYDWLGLPLTEATRARFAVWQREHPSGAHGGHRYSPSDYGLSPEAIREEYDFYIRAFDVETGPARALPARAKP